MAKQVKLTTTGTQDPAIFSDLGGRLFEHPTINYDLALEYKLNELIESEDLQAGVDLGYVTLLDEFGNSITDIEDYVLGASGGTANTPIFDIDNYSNELSYIGYGTASGSTKILRISSTGGTYDSLYADGNQVFDKNWGDRYLYNYF